MDNIVLFFKKKGCKENLENIGQNAWHCGISKLLEGILSENIRQAFGKTD